MRHRSESHPRNLASARKGEKTNAQEAAQHREQAIALLNSYLASKRVRRIDEELSARLGLGQTLFAQGKLDEAKTALDVSQMKAPKSGTGKQTLFVVKQLQGRVESKIELDKIKEKQ